MYSFSLCFSKQAFFYLLFKYHVTTKLLPRLSPFQKVQRCHLLSKQTRTPAHTKNTHKREKKEKTTHTHTYTHTKQLFGGTSPVSGYAVTALAPPLMSFRNCMKRRPLHDHPPSFGPSSSFTFQNSRCFHQGEDLVFLNVGLTDSDSHLFYPLLLFKQWIEQNHDSTSAVFYRSDRCRFSLLQL